MFWPTSIQCITFRQIRSVRTVLARTIPVRAVPVRTVPAREVPARTVPARTVPLKAVGELIIYTFFWQAFEEEVEKNNQAPGLRDVKFLTLFGHDIELRALVWTQHVGS